MKIIYPNNITNVQSINQDASYPASNTEDDYPKRVWKAQTQEGDLMIDVASRSNAVAIFGVTADTIKYTRFPQVTALNTLTTNGDFEDWTTGDPDDWAEGTYVTSDADTGYDGTGYSCKLTSTSSRSISQVITTTASLLYGMSFRYINDSVTDIMQYSIYDNINAADIVSWTDLDNTTSWDWQQILFTTPAACTEIIIYFRPKDYDHDVWIDNAYVYELASNNVTTNGDFEAWTTNDPDDWTEGANVTTDEDTGWTGESTDSSIKLTAADTSDKTIQQNITVEAGKKHELSFRYKNTAGDLIQYRIYDNTNSTDIVSWQTLTSSTAWESAARAFTTPAGCLEVTISIQPEDYNDIVWVDDIYVYKTEDNNLLLNSEFDTWSANNPSSWTEGANLTTDENTGWDGTGSSCKLTATNTADKELIQEKAVTAEKYYSLSFHYKNSTNDIGQYAIYDVTNGADIVALTDLDNKTAWDADEIPTIVIFKTPVSCTNIRVRFTPKTTNDIVWIDQVYLCKTEDNNLSTNGKFINWTTSDPDNWTEGTEVTTDSDTGWDGTSYSCKLTTAAESDKNIYQTITVTASTEYALTFHYKNDTAAIAQYRIYDVTNAADITAWTDLDSKLSWISTETPFSVQFTTPVGCTSLRLYFDPKEEGDIVWFDDVYLYKTAANTLTVNGTFEAWTASEPDNWILGAQLVLSQETGYAGSYACGMTTASSANVSLTQNITVTAEERYCASFYYKNDDNASLRYSIYDVSNSAEIIAWTTAADKTSWSVTDDDYALGFETPAGCTEIQIRFQPYDDSDIVWIDDVHLVVKDEYTLYDLSGIDTYFELIKDDGNDSYACLWIDYDYQDTDHRIWLNLDTDDDNNPAKVGIARAGFARTYQNPDWGLKEGLEDFSITKELNNGSFYYRKRDVARTFSGQITIARDRDFYNFMHSTIRSVGPQPLAWRITDLLNNDWIIFARMKEMPSGSHSYFGHSSIQFSIIEAL